MVLQKLLELYKVKFITINRFLVQQTTKLSRFRRVSYVKMILQVGKFMASIVAESEIHQTLQMIIQKE